MASLSKGIWSNFSKRSPSLAIKSKKLQEAVLSPHLPHGPVSLKKGASRIRYNSPVGMDEIYPLAYNALQEESAKTYQKIELIEKKIAEVGNGKAKEELEQKRENLLVEAEKNNPEVVYRSMFATNSVDRTQPVYRRFLEEKWKGYNRMLTMQRLETLGVIPDTMPTLNPEIEVNVVFPCNSLSRKIEPGTILSSNVTSRPPSFEIIEFKKSKNDLYTILVVDPDIPDVENDAYKTELLWALKDVPASNDDPIIDAKKLISHPECELVSYIPSVPEKNTGNHRISAWVFRQADGKKLKAANKAPEREGFDIRKFSTDNNLKAIGAHVWRSAWDRNTENVRRMYGLPKGRIFTRERS